MNLDAIDSHFHELENVENVPVDRSVLQLLAKHGKLNTDELKLAYQYSPLYPKREEWLFIAYRFFMGAGLLLTLSGIIFFFAYNWGNLHKFVKLGLVQGGIVAIAIGILTLKPSEFVLKLGLTAISVLVGIAFAVFGQIYQTGADAYDFFLGWTIFITAWVAIASFPFLWLFYLFLINVTLALYFEQVQPSWSIDALFLLAVLINLVALISWEYTTRKNQEEWTHKASIRLIGGVVVLLLTSEVVRAIFENTHSVFVFMSVLLYIGSMIGGSIIYIQKKKDIAFATMVAISLLVIGNCLVIRVLGDSFSDLFGVFLLLFFLNIGVTIVLTKGLLKINKEWAIDSIHNKNAAENER